MGASSEIAARRVARELQPPDFVLSPRNRELARRKFDRRGVAREVARLVRAVAGVVIVESGARNVAKSSAPHEN